MEFVCQGKVSKGIGVTKCNVYKRIRYEFTGFDIGFSQKKVTEFLIFVIFDVLFVDVRHILGN